MWRGMGRRNFGGGAFMVLSLGLMSGFAQAQPVSLSQTALELERVGRIANGAFSPRLRVDIRDPDILSPKSVRFSADGQKIYINSLEGAKTVIYSWPELKKIKSIYHGFTVKDAALFHGETTVFDYPYYRRSSSGNPNIFVGKPVESELSHEGRWLWVPYYRRDFDPSGQSPGAVAIIDTETDTIVRVMPTGPIPKYVTASADGRYVAIVHWGDNTVGIIDTSSGDPKAFKYVSHLTVEYKMSQAGLGGANRDAVCGYCLRGAVFTPDGENLLVARMGKGGIAGFHVPSGRYLGSIMAIQSTPRHLALSPDGEFIYASSNMAGYVSKARLSDVVAHLNAAGGQRVNGPQWKEARVGSGARTLDVSPDGQLLFVAVNKSSELVAVDARSMKVVSRLRVDPYAVGLAVAPDLSAVILTSQGRSGVGGGNAVNIIGVRLGDYYRLPVRMN